MSGKYGRYYTHEHSQMASKCHKATLYTHMISRTKIYDVQFQCVKVNNRLCYPIKVSEECRDGQRHALHPDHHFRRMDTNGAALARQK